MRVKNITCRLILVGCISLDALDALAGGFPARPFDSGHQIANSTWRKEPVEIVLESQPPHSLAKANTNHAIRRMQAGRIDTLLAESFENVFPAGLWNTYDKDGATNGEYFWAKKNYRSRTGSASVWCVGGGAQGSGLTQGAHYPPGANSYLVYGPFDLSRVNWAALSMYVWFNCQSNDDYFQFLASEDGSNFYGYQISGNSGGNWADFSLALTAVPKSSAFIDLTGKAAVWIALRFKSNSSLEQAEGAYVDDLLILNGLLHKPQVLQSFDTPGIRPLGITYDGSHLYCIDDVLGRINKMTTTGQVLSGFVSPGTSPSGLAWDGHNLWNADFFNDQIFKLDSTGGVLNSFTAPGAGASGIAWDGSGLWYCDISSPQIWKLGVSGDVLNQIVPRFPNHSDLTWDGRNLWVLDNQMLLLCHINATGQIIEYMIAPPPFPAGLVFDGEKIWLSDNTTQKIYSVGVDFKTFPHDIGATRIDLPHLMSPDDSLQVKVEVKNFGQNSESSFTVYYRIDQDPLQSQLFTTVLASGASQVLTFNKWWHPPAEGAYQFKAWTGLATDEQRSNDSTAQQLIVRKNQKPVLRVIGGQSIEAGQSKTISLQAVDSDADLLHWQITGNPGFLSLSDIQQTDSTASAGLTLSPGAQVSGPFTAQVTVSDGRGGQAKQDFAINVFQPEPNGVWVKRNPTFSFSSSLQSVRFAGASTGWTVGYNKIMKTSDGGDTWNSQTTGKASNQSFRDVFCLDELTAWVVGSANDTIGPVMKTTDGGQTWRGVKTKISSHLQCVYFVDSQTGWVAAEQGAIYASVDGGLTWEQQTSGTTNWINAIWFTDKQNGLVVGSNGTVLRTEDGGKLWRKVDIGTDRALHKVFFIDQMNGWISSLDSPVYHTTDGGSTWKKSSDIVSGDMYGLFFLDKNIGWAVGTWVGINGRVCKTENGGQSWKVLELPDDLNSVWFTSSLHGCAVGENGATYITTDGGLTWKNRSAATTKSLWAVNFIDANNGWAGGNNGQLINTADGGKTWNYVPISKTEGINGLVFTDRNNGWACQNRGKILRTSNGGQNWYQLQTSTNRDFYGIFFYNAMTGWAVGGANEIEGLVFKTTDGGNNWISKGKVANQPLMDVFFAGADSGWAVSMQGIILQTVDGGEHWVKQNSQTIAWLTDVWFKNSREGFVVGDGTLLRTWNGGESWISMGSLDGIGEEICFIDSRHGWIVGTGSGVAKGIGGNSPGIFLLSSGSPNIWKTDDGGDTWKTEKLTAGGWLLNVCALDLNKVIAVGSGGTVYEYTNTLPIPAVPANLAAIPLSTDKIKMTWTDLSDNEHGFTLFRSDIHSGAYKPVGLISANTQTCIDSGLTPNTRYWYRMAAHNATGFSSRSPEAFTNTFTTAVETSGELLYTFALEQNYPNPFNPETFIEYSLAQTCQVELTLYDALGRQFAVLLSERKTAGRYRYVLHSQGLSSGVYFYRIKAGPWQRIRKMVVLH